MAPFSHNPPRDRDQYLVPDLMTPVVVHGLKAVEIDIVDGEPVRMFARSDLLSENVESLLKEPAIGETRQAVVAREMGYFGFPCALLGDVLGNGEDILPLARLSIADHRLLHADAT